MAPVTASTLGQGFLIFSIFFNSPGTTSYNLATVRNIGSLGKCFLPKSKKALNLGSVTRNTACP
jgi:hypothetical protein